MKDELKKKVKEWEEWNDFDEDSMNDHLRDFFEENLSRAQLWGVIELIKSTP
jgi:hypothetical protein